MSGVSGIEWCDATWEVTAGCSHVSSGCANCYAEVLVGTRLYGSAVKRRDEGRANGSVTDVSLEVIDPDRRRWNGRVALLEGNLEQPLRRRTPTVYFVNSRSDLFHPDVPFDFIDRVFAVMALCPHHVFLVLTKRPERMLEYLTQTGSIGHRIYQQVSSWLDDGGGVEGSFFTSEQWDRAHELAGSETSGFRYDMTAWNFPLPNVWLGTSVEDEITADARIPALLGCPVGGAAGRFVSAEPLLEGVNLDRIESRTVFPEGGSEQRWDSAISGKRFNEWAGWDIDAPKLDWVIVGGESGAKARPTNVQHLRDVKDQCRRAGVPVFVKQLGKWCEGPHEFDGWKGVIDRWMLRDSEGNTTVIKRPVIRATYHPEHYDDRPHGAVAWGLAHPKGADMGEWPKDLRVREVPEGIAAVMTKGGAS